MAVHFPSDFNVFSLVTTQKSECKFPDESIRKIVSDKIGREFIGTLEMNDIIYTMLDLEQYIGRPINWVAGMDFESLIDKKKRLPGVMMRFCTTNLKIEPINQFWLKNIGEPVEMQIGFRANENSRAQRMIERCQPDGFIHEKMVVGKHENGKNKWKTFKMSKPSFPLIENRIFKDQIENFWQNKNVRFAKYNNCVGCFHRNEIFLNYISKIEPSKFDWFIDMEKKTNRTFKDEIDYLTIKNHKLQIRLFESDFSSCDSGFCSL